jgi:hypothetical protein
MGFLLKAFATAAASEPSAADERTRVQTDSGKVRGTAAEGVIAFKGVPFAQPPVGALRWRAPQPIKPWDGIRDTVAFSPNPVQPPPSAGSALSTLASAGFSEDCLYLNLWRPATTESKPLPVMVWIHAGGLVRVAETFAVRSWMFHAAAGALAAGIGAGLAGDVADDYGLFAAPRILIAAGLAAGLVYWLVAGSTAGFWKPLRTPRPRPAQPPPS